MPRNTDKNDPSRKAPDTLVRINKALASAGVCSRRAADELVAAGRVRVNGAVVDSAGAKVDPRTDAVQVDGKRVDVPVPGRVEHTTLMLHKPVQVVTTAHDPEGRKTVMDLLPSQYKDVRLFPVGRLDFFSEGLILLTDDGELANRLTHPRWHLPKVYRVVVRGAVRPGTVERFRSGMTLDEGEKLTPVETVATPGPADTTTLELTLVQGVNRQIRRMCRDEGLTILRLSRVAQGPVELGDLPPGESRPLTPAELAALRGAVDLEATAPPSPAPQQAKRPVGYGKRTRTPGKKKAPGANRGRKR